MFAHAAPADNPLLRELADALQTYVRDAAAQGAPAHEAETRYLAASPRFGTCCPRPVLRPARHRRPGSNRRPARRPALRPPPEPHPRRYVSIFGPFTFAPATAAAKDRNSSSCRWTIACSCPSACSYVLQDWDQSLCVEQAFGQTQARSAGFSASGNRWMGWNT